MTDPKDEQHSEWQYVMSKVRAGRDPSNEHLRRLLLTQPEPEGLEVEIRQYVASRIGKGPGAKPFAAPEKFDVYGVFTARQFCALMDLRHLHSELQKYITSEPGPSVREIPMECLLPMTSAGEQPERVKVRLKRVDYRRVWKVKGPKTQALEIVADRWHVPMDTLLDWESKYRSSSYPGQPLF